MFSRIALPSLPLAPTSTLSPYTTLFRSFKWLDYLSGIGIEQWFKIIPDMPTNKKVSTELVPARAAEKRGEDRKSTRLNSSHLVISYAVFCLKNKRHSEG